LKYAAVPKKRWFIYGGGHRCVLGFFRPLVAGGWSAKDHEVSIRNPGGYF